MIVAVAEDVAGVSFPQQQTATQHHHKERQTCWTVLFALSIHSVSLKLLHYVALRYFHHSFFGSPLFISHSLRILKTGNPRSLTSPPGPQTEDDILSARLLWGFESGAFISTEWPGAIEQNSSHACISFVKTPDRANLDL